MLKVFCPLLITSLALALAFKMKFWNIGGEGEFLMGAICASCVAFNCSSLPSVAVILLMCLAAMLSSGILGLAIAALKVKFNTNETLMTLMLNYIMLYVIKYLGDTKADWNFFLREDSERPIFGKFPDNAQMGGIKIGSFNLLWSVVCGVLLTVLIYFYLKSTKQGYEIQVVGDSAQTAKIRRHERHKNNFKDNVPLGGTDRPRVGICRIHSGHCVRLHNKRCRVDGHNRCLACKTFRSGNFCNINLNLDSAVRMSGCRDAVSGNRQPFCRPAAGFDFVCNSRCRFCGNLQTRKEGGSKRCLMY